MLPIQQTLQFSDFTDIYDLIIPKDNLLRRINDLVDFSFIQKELMDKNGDFCRKYKANPAAKLKEALFTPL